jgi:hypothetical protein
MASKLSEAVDLASLVFNATYEENPAGVGGVSRI